MSTDTTEGQLTCTDDMKNMHIMCTEQVDVICANCGKEGSDLNICNKCKMVKYCNAACKKKHRSKHKKKCERRVAELYDIELFKQPPKKEDCPICFLTLPCLGSGSQYYACCGKTVCNGCIFAVRLRVIIGKGEKCPFCRTPATKSDKENIKRLKKRVESGDAEAIFSLGYYYYEGSYGLPQDYEQALKLWQQAGELGCAEAYGNIGNAYHFGEGVERDNKKADHYYELAAIGGNETARYNTGNSERRVCNWDRAIKHYMIAAGGGWNGSVKSIQQLYTNGHAKKDNYTSALRAYQKYLQEIRSEQRDIAAAFSEEFKYY